MPDNVELAQFIHNVLTSSEELSSSIEAYLTSKPEISKEGFDCLISSMSMMSVLRLLIKKLSEENMRITDQVDEVIAKLCDG